MFRPPFFNPCHPMNKITGDIYLLTNLVNGKIYVGQTRCAKGGYLGRWKDHVYVAEREDEPRWYIDRAIKKHGKDNFNIELLECSDFYDIASCVDWMDERESFYIKKFNTKIDGYNLTDGGRGNRGWKMPESQRMAQSIRMKGLPGFATGVSKTEDWKKKHSKLMKTILTKEWIGKMQAGSLSKDALKRRGDSIRKPVLQYSIDGLFLKKFDGIITAAAETGICRSRIGLNCNKKVYSAGGFIWEFNI